jgi:hypothetical protein
MQALYPANNGIHQLGKQVPLIALQWQGKWNELITQSDAFLAQCPESVKVYVSLPGLALYLKGFALQKLSRDTEAIAVYEQAVQQYPDSRFTDTGLMFIGRCYEHLGDFHSAISTYNRYLTIFPGRTLTYAAYLAKAEGLAKLEQYTEAIATLDTFITNYADRYDCLSGFVRQAQVFKQKYQAQISPIPLTSKEMGQLKGGCPCYPCGITGCSCLLCNTTPKCGYCRADNCVCTEGECNIGYAGCACGNHCGCELTCHYQHPVGSHVFSCGYSGNNPGDRTCGCAGAAQCPCCSGPKCGSCTGSKSCDCLGSTPCGCPNYCKDLISCPTCSGSKPCKCDDMSIDCKEDECIKYCSRLSICPTCANERKSCGQVCDTLLPASKTGTTCNLNPQDQISDSVISHRYCQSLESGEYHYTCGKFLCKNRKLDISNHIPPCLEESPDHGYWCCGGCNHVGHNEPSYGGVVYSGCGDSSPGLGRDRCMKMAHCKDGPCDCETSQVIFTIYLCECSPQDVPCHGDPRCIHCRGTANIGTCPENEGGAECRGQGVNDNEE